MFKTFCEALYIQRVDRCTSSVKLKHCTSDNFIKYDIKCGFHIYRTITLIFNNITTVPLDNFLLSGLFTDKFHFLSENQFLREIR